jgi:hypothetical protein
MDDDNLPPERLAEHAGITRTVYSLIFPETRRLTEAMWQGAAHENLHDMFERAWTKRQDPLHLALFDAWRDWSAPVLTWDAAAFAHRYPTAGSSEAIRDAIAHLRAHCSGARLHVFHGDYEGYEALAAAFALPVVHHDRDRGDQIAEDPRFGPEDVFVCSHPSSLDGNLWSGYDGFMQAMQRRGHRVWLDLCYVGCVARPYRIELGYTSIDKVFWSLSKVFGVYYHRIGGVLSRQEMPGLYGNIWFKNLHSIELGRRLLRATSVRQLPLAYARLQAEAVAQLAQHLGDAPPVRASDVVILANRPIDRHQPHPVDRLMARAATTPSAIARYCLTPFMGQRLDAGAGAARSSTS